MQMHELYKIFIYLNGEFMKKIFLLIAVLLTLTITNVQAQFVQDVIVTSSNGIWTDSRAYATLNDAITAVGANKRTIVISSQQTVTALTIPSTVTLRFERDGSIANSAQLTINTKNIEADNHQIFTGVGNIDFASGTIVKSSWFQNIETAFALTGNDTITLLMTAAHTVTASYSPGNNVLLKWDSPGNILTTNAGVTVGNLKLIEAGPYQIFGGAGDFDFLDGTYLKSDWFNRLRSAVSWIESELVTIELTSSETLDMNLTIPTNIILSFNNTMISGAFTLAFAGSPNAQIKALPDQQIFGSTTTITFGTVGGGEMSPKWWGAKGDNSTDDTVPLQKAINAASYSGHKVKIPSGIYLYTTLYLHYDAANNPNINTATRGNILTIEGEGCIHGSTYRGSLYTASDFQGTVLKSTITTGDAFIIGIGTPYASRRQAGSIKIRGITFLGETTGRIVSVGYAAEGFLIENCFIGMKENVAGTALHINNAWGSIYRNVWIASKTAVGDIVTGPQSIGVNLDTDDEGTTPGANAGGGCFYFEMVSVNNFYTGFKLNGANVTMLSCNDYQCETGIKITDNSNYQIINQYSENDLHYGLDIILGVNINVTGGIFLVSDVTIAAIKLGTAAETSYVKNVTLEHIRFWGINESGGSGILRYADAFNIDVKNIRASLYDNPFVEMSPNVSTDIIDFTMSNMSYYADDDGTWTYDKSKLIYNIGGTTDYSRFVYFSENKDLRRGSGSGIYDFSVDTGAIGTYVLGQIPDNATITYANYEVITPPASSGSATLQWGVGNDDPQGLVVNTAYNNAIFNAGYHDSIANGVAANFTTKTTAYRYVDFFIVDAALTAGKIYFYWDWIASE